MRIARFALLNHSNRGLVLDLLYNHIRHVLFLECTKVNYNFASMSDTEKLCLILSDSSICSDNLDIKLVFIYLFM